jgi:hypothetical protein
MKNIPRYFNRSLRSPDLIIYPATRRMDRRRAAVALTIPAPMVRKVFLLRLIIRNQFLCGNDYEDGNFCSSVKRFELW